MNKFKKIISLILIFAMVLSMTVVSSAAEMTAAEKAEVLSILLGEGSGVTDEYLAKIPTRMQAVIISLRLKGLEKEALDYEGSEKFSDHNEITWDDGRKIASYAKANPELGWIGTNGALLPNETITAQQFVKVMLESLGYTQGSDFEWAEVFTFAASVGLKALSKDTMMTNTSLAEGMIEALGAKTKSGTVLVNDLIGDGAIDVNKAKMVGLVEENLDFDLSSVESFGLNAVKITFTSDVDEDEDIIIEVEDEDGDDVTVDPDFTVYGNIIIAVFGDNDTEDYTWSNSDAEIQRQNTKLDLVISAIGIDGRDVDEEDASVTMSDKKDPELVSVIAEDAMTIVVKYSEPIIPSSYEYGSAVFDDVHIDDTKLVGEATWSDDFTTITYVLNDPVDEGTKLFTTEAVEDFAGFVADSESISIKVTEDDKAPQLEEIDYTSTRELILIFDEDIENVGDIEVDGDEVSSTNIDENEISITLSEALDATAVFVSIKITWEEVEDAFGNKDDGETSYKAPMDDKAPTLKIEVSSDNELVFIFSEEVTGFDVDDIVLYDDEDNEVSGFFSASIKSDETDIDDYEDDDDDDTIYYLNLSDPDANSGEYTIKIDGSDSDITDLSILKNELESVETTIEFNDKLDPEIDEVLIIDGNWDDDAKNETIRIGFSEEMDIDTLEDEDNYIVSGEPLKTYDDYEIDADKDGLYVDITIEGEELEGLTLKLYGLDDAQGNSLESGTSAVIEFAPASFDDATFKLTDLDEIEVTSLNGTFSDVDPDDFVLYEADGTTAVTILYISKAEIDDDDNSVILLTVSDDLTADGSVELTVDGSLIVMIGVEDGDTANEYNVPLVMDPSTVTDSVDPTAEIDFEDNDNENILYVRFDESVVATEDAIDDSLIIYNEEDDEYVDASDLNIKFYDVDDDLVDAATDAYVYFTLDFIPDEEYTITLLSRYILDTSDNVAEGVNEDTYLPE